MYINPVPVFGVETTPQNFLVNTTCLFDVLLAGGGGEELGLLYNGQAITTVRTTISCLFVKQLLLAAWLA
jgi:hypothetical protein